MTVFFKQTKIQNIVVTVHGEVLANRCLKNIYFALGPGSHVVSYPINNDGDVSFVAVRKEDFQFKESWKELGSLSNLLQDFSNYDSRIFPELKAEEPLYKWGIYIRPPLQSMTAKILL